MEWMTKQLEEKAFQMIDLINERGGFLKYWETGLFRKELEESAYQRQEEVNKGEKVIVGRNRYVSEEKQKIPLFKHDPEAEKTMVERVRNYRAQRDNDRTQRALEQLEKVAEEVKQNGSKNTPMVMEALIEASLSDATFGEMAGTLKRVFGWDISY
jgi:methylmalonyl-CoA mutase N-terminal domain/subunit